MQLTAYNLHERRCAHHTLRVAHVGVVAVAERARLAAAPGEKHRRPFSRDQWCTGRNKPRKFRTGHYESHHQKWSSNKK